jgi:hypothetical protein
MEFIIFFSYERKTFQMQSSREEVMQTIFSKFANKLEKNINDFDFFYEGNKIDKNKKLSDLIHNENKKEIVVSVEKKLKIIKCPQCICNDCIINIEDYKIQFTNCKYGHTVYKIFDEYKESQKIDHSKIFCSNNKCGVNQKDCPSNFYKCLICTKLVGRTRYYCNKCNKEHSIRHKDTKLYDEKNYYCEKDFKQLISYCEDCNKDLCEVCQNSHLEHKISSYDSMIQNNVEINNIKKDLEKIKDKIVDLKFIIDNIKDHLDGALKIFQQYCEIGQDIIEKYVLYNKNLKNHRVLQSIINLNKSNKKVKKDLIQIIEEKNLRKQTNNLIKIFEDDRNNYREGIGEPEEEINLDFNKKSGKKIDISNSNSNSTSNKKPRNSKQKINVKNINNAEKKTNSDIK